MAGEANELPITPRDAWGKPEEITAPTTRTKPDVDPRDAWGTPEEIPAAKSPAPDPKDAWGRRETVLDPSVQAILDNAKRSKENAQRIKEQARERASRLRSLGVRLHMLRDQKAAAESAQTPQETSGQPGE